MKQPPVRDRLVTAAFELFAEQGYENTTVDEIAERAGVGRTTFFRHYRSKEDVIFPDHDRLLAAIQDRLATSAAETAVAGVTDAVRLVLLHYLDEGARSKQRYALTSTVPALRDREIASSARYQRVFREYITDWMGGQPGAALRAELMAAAVVSAHNHVLRRWLRGDTKRPIPEVDAAMAQVVELFTAPDQTLESNAGSVVLVVRDSRSPDNLMPIIRAAIERNDRVPSRSASRKPRSRS